ncbi:hypothetical protein NHX12_014367 [Muraenolepis orangiensis]|uniref:Uncharacterized protein n=1 Tax=Muraenolepis orangiensis TaxID=630683 RepID=A0A9Q0DDM0_9TELE|nr:hypothetical protein NHX12_014367 [Muraenolepis orangiensis]
MLYDEPQALACFDGPHAYKRYSRAFQTPSHNKPRPKAWGVGVFDHHHHQQQTPPPPDPSGVSHERPRARALMRRDLLAVTLMEQATKDRRPSVTRGRLHTTGGRPIKPRRLTRKVTSLIEQNC